MDASTASPSKVQKPSVPISRTNGPGYERPERARTSHACEPCRERKTKCDGERPSCRRCMHTGTGCHYGYGKGWRKRKTAEDLTATWKKLQRYEALLTDIMPMVNQEVRTMIEDVRSQELATTPDSLDSGQSLPLPQQGYAERDLNSASSRTSLSLPVPASMTSSQMRLPGPPLRFDRVAESTSPHLAHHPKRELPYEEPGTSRLPSITAHGLLIETPTRDQPALYPRALTTPTDHLSPPSTSATSENSTLSGWSSSSDTLVDHTDMQSRHRVEFSSRLIYALPSDTQTLATDPRSTWPTHADYLIKAIPIA